MTMMSGGGGDVDLVSNGGIGAAARCKYVPRAASVIPSKQCHHVAWDNDKRRRRMMTMEEEREGWNGEDEDDDSCDDGTKSTCFV